jgi:hypothetical protein
MCTSNKEKYRKLCNEKPIPLFMQAWWMDAVCCEGKKWDVLLVEQNEEIKASLVYHVVNRLGFKLIIQPQFTQYNGIWIDYSGSINNQKKYVFEKEIMNDFIEQLKQLKINYFEQNFHHSITNWLPFYWNGFKQTTRYTYQINNLTDIENIYSSFSYAKKKQIKKTEKDFKVDFSIEAKEFYELHKHSLSTDGKKIAYSMALFQSIYNAATAKEQGAIIGIRDLNNNLHAALFIVWNSDTAYNLISAINPLYKSSGASTRVVWEAIKFLSNKTTIFDFEGSMIEGVAQSFQQFGTEQVPYFNISKLNSKSLSILLRIKQSWK